MSELPEPTPTDKRLHDYEEAFRDVAFETNRGLEGFRDPIVQDHALSKVDEVITRIAQKYDFPLAPTAAPEPTERNAK